MIFNIQIAQNFLISFPERNLQPMPTTIGQTAMKKLAQRGVTNSKSSSATVTWWDTMTITASSIKLQSYLYKPNRGERRTSDGNNVPVVSKWNYIDIRTSYEFKLSLSALALFAMCSTYII